MGPNMAAAFVFKLNWFQFPNFFVTQEVKFW